MNKFNKIKESLKRSLKKNKNVGYSKAILIIFLMLGGIFTYAKKEDKYSYQIFFSYRFNNTKNLDNTLFNFNTQEYEEDNLINNPRRGKGLIHRYGKFFGGNGIILEDVNHFDTVSFAANIKAKKSPKIDLDKPQTKDIQIENIFENEPEIKNLKLSIDKLDIKEPESRTFKSITVPVISKIDNIDKPIDVQVDSLGEVENRKIDSRNKEIPNINKPIINVFKNSIRIKPIYVDIPKVPKLIKIEEINIQSPKGYAKTADPRPDLYGFLNYNAGNISQVTIKKGQFNVEKDKTTIKDYETVSYREEPIPVFSNFDKTITSEILEDNKKKKVDNYGTIRSTKFPVGTKLEFKDGRTATLKFQEDGTKKFVYDNNEIMDSESIPKETIVKLPNEDYEIIKRLEQKTKKVTDSEGKTKIVPIPYEITVKMPDGSDYNTLIQVTDNNTWEMIINLPDGKKATVVKVGNEYKLKNYVINEENSRFFYTLLDATYSEFSKDVVINFNNSEGTAVINFESQSSVDGNLDKDEENKFITSEKKKYLKDNQKYYGVHGTDNGKTELLFINKGKINLVGEGTTYMISTNAGEGGYRTNYVDNEGEIKANGKNTVILNRTADSGGSNDMVHVFSNSTEGKMYANGENSVVYMTSNGNLHISKSAFINDGVIQLNGKNSIGVFYTDGGPMGDYWKNSNTYLIWIKKPIEIRGEKAKGFVIQNNGIGVTNLKNLFKANILENSKQAIGILQDTKNNTNSVVTATKIEIDTNASETESKNIGIYANKGKIDIVDAHKDSLETNKTSSVILKGGNGNIGLFSTGDDSVINFKGLLKIEKVGNAKHHKLATTLKGGKVNIDGNIEVGKQNSIINDSISLYSSDENSVLTLKDTSKKDIYLTGKSYIAYAVNKGKIKINGSKNNISNLNLINDDINRKQGIGLVADTGGKIDVSNSNVSVKYGELGIGALHNSNINFTNSKLDYVGNGYAVYADDNSKVDISSSTIELRDGAVAFEIDGNENSQQNVIMDSNTRIKPMEDGITIFSLKNFNNISTIGGVKDNIVNVAKRKLKESRQNVTLDNLIDIKDEHGNYKYKYKVAAIDGGVLTVGSLDKSATIEDGEKKDSENLTSEQKAKRDGYQFYNLLQAQRLNATTVSGSKIKAVMNSEKAKQFNGQIVAFEMNSSTNATNNSDAQINLVETQIEAARIDNGKGAIGLFINYGKVNVDGKSSILVENQGENKNGVGIYSVNGSEVDNKGNITVGGTESVGILAKSYREDDKGVIQNEFGEKQGQGTLKVVNQNKITMKGSKGVGIYADNNNIENDVKNNSVNNSGIIDITNDNGIGIYGTRVSISNNNNINILNKGIGIYSENSKLNELGNITFKGNDGVGLYLKGIYDTELDKKVLKVKSAENSKNNIGVYSEDDITTTLKVDAIGENITNYYSKGNINVNTSSKVVKGGIGISADGDKTITYETNDDKNLAVGENAIGIYGNKNTIELKGKIILDGNKSRGIYADSGIVNIDNKIKFNSENSVGIQALNGAIVNVLNTDSINFSENKNNIGYYLSNSKIDFRNDINFKDANSNIYVYSKDSSTIKFKNAIIDGKAIGMYLEGTNKIEGTNLSAINSGIGIYNNGENEISNLKVESSDKGIGIYSEKNIVLNNTTFTSENAVSIYSKGDVNLKTETNLNLKNKGVGIYLDEKGSLIGSKINVVSDSSENGVAIYYKGNKESNRDINNNVDVTNQKNVIVTYVSNSKVTNKSTININGGKNSIGSFVTDGASFTNKSNINLTNVENGNAVYAKSGVAENEGNIKVDSETSIAMVANEGSTIKNSGNIANEKNIAMYLTNGNGENSGTITAKIGAYIKGEKAKFTNLKDIKANNIGIYLEENKGNSIKLENGSKIILTKNNSVGVYSNNSIIDFDIKPDVEENLKDVVSLYASGNTLINSKISTAKGENSIAVYLEDSSVNFGEKANIDITEGKSEKYNTGIYTSNSYKGKLNININAINPYTIGLRVGENSTVDYNGQIVSVGENAVGTLVEGKFTTNNKTKFNVLSGVGIYITKGNVDINNSKFILSNNAIAIHQEGGNLNLNGKINASGEGTLLSLKNIDKEIKGNIDLGEGAKGIVASYDDDNVHKILLSEGKTIKLDNNSWAISAISKKSDNVTIENKGSIETYNENTNNAVGIYANNTKVLNYGKINTNKGIYLTKKSDLENYGKIILTSNEAVGILGYNLNNDLKWKVGNIQGTNKINQIGVFVEKNTSKISLEDININLLGSNSKGVIFKNGKIFEVKGNDNKIKVSEESIGLASINTDGEVKNTTILLGNKGTGVYLKGKKELTFGGEIKEDNGGGSTLVSVDEGIINLNVDRLVVSKQGVGLAAINNGKIYATKDTDISVNGGIGAYINSSEVDKFSIDVKEGIGIYAVGTLNSNKMPKITLSGDNSKAYVFKNLENKFTLNELIVGENNKQGQIGIYTIGKGNGLEVNHINVLGTKNYGIFNTANQEILVKNIEVSGNSIGIYSNVVNNVKIFDEISVNNGAIGVYKIGGKIINSASIKGLNSSVGLYSKDSDIELNNSNIMLDRRGTIGVKSDNSNVVVNENLHVIQLKEGDNNSVGIYSLNGGETKLNKGLQVGNYLIGVYQKEGKLSTKENLDIFENGVGIFLDNAEIESMSNLNVKSNAKGIYGENSIISSNGSINIHGNNAIGISARNNSNIKHDGDIVVLGQKSVGIYGDDSNIINKGKITVNDIDGIGIYGLNNNITSTSEMDIKEDAIGILKKGKGVVTLTSNKANVSDKGYAVYYEGETKEKSKLVSTINEMTLGKEAVGIYANNVDIKYTGNIHVGESGIAEDGFENYDNNTNSVGIYATDSKLEYKGNLMVDKPLSVGIYAKDTTNVVIKDGSNITVLNGAFGIMTSEDSKANITIDRGTTFNIKGRANDKRATKINVSIGVAMYGGTLTNYGTFNITDGALGLYYNENTKFINEGIFKLTNGGVSVKHTANEFNIGLGKMKLKKNGNIIFNVPNKMDFVNSGVMDIDGNINLNGLQLNLNNHMHIDANEFEGIASINPEFSKGNSTLEYVYKDIFRLKSDNGLGKFMGDVKSQSITWIAKVGKLEQKTLNKVDPKLSESKTKDIIMTRIPYTVLIKGPKYDNLAKGLDKVRLSIPSGVSSEIFKSLDKINNYGDFANSIANIRGDMYSNIQERVLDISNEFDKSYDELLESNNSTSKVHKFSAIYSNCKHTDETIGVSPYNRNTLGLLYLNDKENEKEDTKFGYSLGVSYSKFDFVGDTSRGSNEKVYAGTLGLHYLKNKNNFKFLTRLNVGVNYHNANRLTHILNNDNDKYTYNAKYWSMVIDWKNKFGYDINIGSNFVLTPYAKLDLMYGKIFNIKEDGRDTILALNVKANDIFVISPKIGIDAKYDINLKNNKYITLKGQIEYRYDVLPLYRKSNKAEFQKSNTEYDLSVLGYRTTSFKLEGEVEFGKKDKWGVALGVAYENAMKYQLRFNYKF